jgi:hypothetical protein
MMPEQQGDIHPFAQPVQAASATVDQFMGIRVADLTKKETRGNK